MCLLGQGQGAGMPHLHKEDLQVLLDIVFQGQRKFNLATGLCGRVVGRGRVGPGAERMDSTSADLGTRFLGCGHALTPGWLPWPTHYLIRKVLILAPPRIRKVLQRRPEAKFKLLLPGDTGGSQLPRGSSQPPVTLF